MSEIIKEIELHNSKLRVSVTDKDFLDNLQNLSDKEKSQLIEALHVSVNNAKILTNKLLKDVRK